MATALQAGMAKRFAEGPAQRVDLAACRRDGALNTRIGTAYVRQQGGLGPVTNNPKLRCRLLMIGLPVGPIPPPENDLNRDLPRIGALLALGVLKLEDICLTA